MNKKPNRRLVVVSGIVVAVMAMSGIAYAVTSDTSTTTDDQTVTDMGDRSFAEEPLTPDREYGEERFAGDRGVAEEPLTGDLADQVTAAAEAAVPDGTVLRVETDAQGAAYEAHMTDADGNPITVTFDEDLNVLSTDQGR